MQTFPRSENNVDLVQSRIQNPLEYLRWNFQQKFQPLFRKSANLDVDRVLNKPLQWNQGHLKKTYIMVMRNDHSFLELKWYGNFCCIIFRILLLY